jgi:NTP pyrophosphatase (non-canonical NTP hydrolase)
MVNNDFKYFLELIEKSIDIDPWVKDTNLEGYCKEIKKEAEEVIQAIKRKDMENLKEELGDILYDWAHACKLAEQQNLFSLKDVLKELISKIERRKPYLLEKEKKTIAKKDAVRIWYEVKAKEKERKEGKRKNASR